MLIYLLSEQKLLRVILQFSNVRAIVGIDDVRHYHELMEAARQCNIPTVAIQHGHFTKYHLGWLGHNVYKDMRYQRADTLFVWNDYWKQELSRLHSVYPDNAVIVAGFQQSTQTSAFASKEEGVTILIPHETESPKEEVAAYIRALHACTGVSLILKVRPDVPEKEQLETYPSDIRSMVRVVCHIHDVPKPDAVIGVYSTFLYDMATLGVPVLMMDTSMDYGEGMVINDMVDVLPLKGICATLPKALERATKEGSQKGNMSRFTYFFF